MVYESVFSKEQLDYLNDVIDDMTKTAIKESSASQKPFVHDAHITFFRIEPEPPETEHRFFKLVITVYTVVEAGTGFNKNNLYFVPYPHVQEYEISMDEYLDLLNFAKEKDEQFKEND